MRLILYTKWDLFKFRPYLSINGYLIKCTSILCYLREIGQVCRVFHATSATRTVIPQNTRSSAYEGFDLRIFLALTKFSSVIDIVFL